MEGNDGGEGVVDSDGGEGVVDSGRGEQGMVDSGGGEGVNAYPMEYKMTTTIASLSSSPAWCHIADCDTVPLAHCIICGTGDAVCLSFPLVGAGRRLAVIGVFLSFLSLLAVTLIRRGLVCWALAVVCWPLSSLHVFVESLGGWRHFGQLALFVVV